MRDMANDIATLPAIPPVVVADNTAQVGAIIDRSGFNALTYTIVTGDIADPNATFTVLLEHGDVADLSDAAAANADDLIGDPTIDFASDTAAFKLGYVGPKRYTRLTITPIGNEAAAPLAALAVLGMPRDMPVT